MSKTYSIGLYDWDLLHWQQPIAFNLDLMKVAAYYKNRRHLVKMLDKIDLERYGKIILTKDYWDDDFPKEVFLNPKIEHLGLTIGQKSESYLIEEIEETTPDPTIYSGLSRFYNTNRDFRRLFNTMSTAAHARLSRNNASVAAMYERQFSDINMKKKTVLALHDPYPHFVEGIMEVATDLFKEMSPLQKYVFFKHEIRCSSSHDFSYFSNLPRHKHSAAIVIENFLPDEVLYNNKPSSSAKFKYELEVKSREKMIELLPLFFKQAMFYGESNSPLLLNIMNVSDDIETEWYNIVEMLNGYLLYNAYALKSRKKTFYKYCKDNPTFLRKEMIDIFSFVREHNYDLFTLFYECESIIFKRNQFSSRYIGTYN